MNTDLRLSSIWVIPLLACCAFGQALTSTHSDGEPFAYLVCGNGYFYDHRVHRVDIRSGKLAGVSEAIDWMGYPHMVAHDPSLSRLYAASFRGRTWDFWPLTVFEVGGGKFEVVARYSPNPDDTEPRGIQRLLVDEDGTSRYSAVNTLADEIYRLVVSPDGEELYLSHGGLVETEYPTEVWDASTGQVLRRLRQIPPGSRAWSPDGTRVAGFWAETEGGKTSEGGATVAPTPGGVVVKSATSLEVLSRSYLQGNRGLQPPWGRIDRPFIGERLSLAEPRVYDRDTGEYLGSLNLNDLVKIPGASHVYLNGRWPEINSLPVLENPTEVPISVTAVFEGEDLPENIRGGGHERSYLLLLDILESREVWRIEVGVRCSNAVVAYEQ